MMKRLQLLALMALALGALAACGTREDASEDHGDLLQSEQGLYLTEEEHEYGWGKTECLMCHNLENIHQTNRSPEASINLPEIREMIEEEIFAGEGIMVCLRCHGDNGLGLEPEESE